jgi:hypothetical protein
MTFDLSINWNAEPKILQYEKLEPLWQFMDPLDFGRNASKKEVDLVMQFQASKNMITKHYGSIYLTKHFDDVYPYYSLSHHSPYDVRIGVDDEDLEKEIKKSFDEDNRFYYYPDHFTMKLGKYNVVGSRGGENFYTRFTKKIFYSIPWREYVPDGFDETDCEQPLKFKARMSNLDGSSLIDGHSWFDVAINVDYAFDYEGKPTNVEQFVKPIKYKVNRKLLNTLRKTKLKDLQEYVESAYPLLNATITDETYDKYKFDAKDQTTDESHYKTMLHFITQHASHDWYNHVWKLPSLNLLQQAIDRDFKGRQLSVLEPVV